MGACLGRGRGFDRLEAGVWEREVDRCVLFGDMSWPILVNLKRGLLCSRLVRTYACALAYQSLLFVPPHVPYPTFNVPIPAINPSNTAHISSANLESSMHASSSQTPAPYNLLHALASQLTCSPHATQPLSRRTILHFSQTSAPPMSRTDNSSPVP